MIKNYISDVCKLLKIQIPFISYDTSHFTTKTMMAQCSPDGSTIYLNKIDKPNPDYIFAIAHELRHVWQIQTNQVLYFSDYKPIELCSSIEEYNLQLAEVDANAFAAIIMIDLVHLQPQWNGLPNSVVTAIENRINTVIHSLEQ